MASLERRAPRRRTGAARECDRAGKLIVPRHSPAKTRRQGRPPVLVGRAAFFEIKLGPDGWELILHRHRKVKTLAAPSFPAAMRLARECVPAGVVGFVGRSA